MWHDHLAWCNPQKILDKIFWCSWCMIPVSKSQFRSYLKLFWYQVILKKSFILCFYRLFLFNWHARKQRYFQMEDSGNIMKVVIVWEQAPILFGRKLDLPNSPWFGQMHPLCRSKNPPSSKIIFFSNLPFSLDFGFKLFSLSFFLSANLDQKQLTFH